MNNLSYKGFYRRNLPHIQPPGSTLFVTFRLANSIPRNIKAKWRIEQRALENEIAKMNKMLMDIKRQEYARRRFRELEDNLDQAVFGPTWLKDDRIAKLVMESLHHLDNQLYRLDAFCVMSNHVHIVFAPLPIFNQEGKITGYHSLSRIMHSLKRHSAKMANKALKRTGGIFWEHESYDHYIRDQDEWSRIVAYVLNNPVKIGLVNEWQEWPYSYLRQKDGTI